MFVGKLIHEFCNNDQIANKKVLNISINLVLHGALVLVSVDIYIPILYFTADQQGKT